MNIVNFEDNLFFLVELIRPLYKGLSLNIDEPIYVTRYDADIMFIDSQLDHQSDLVLMSYQTIKRKEYLRTAMLAHQHYVDFLTAFSRSDKHEPNRFIAYGQSVEQIKERHRQKTAGLEKILNDRIEPNATEVISQEEMQFLLNQD